MTDLIPVFRQVSGSDYPLNNMHDKPNYNAGIHPQAHPTKLSGLVQTDRYPPLRFREK